MEKDIKWLDALIIGGGPIGLACAIAVHSKKLSYILLEKGCLVNSLYHYPLDMTFFSTAQKLEIGNIPFISNNAKATRTEALEYYRRICSYFSLKIKLYEEVTSVQKMQEGYEVITPKGKYHSKSIIIATGFFDIPNLLHIPGEDLAKVHHYYREAHPYFSQKIAVIGSANSAVDVALETWRKGAEVTMIIKEANFGDHVKYWAKPDIENRIKEGSIKAFFNSELVNISENEITIKTAEKITIIPNHFVFAMTGYLPNFDFLKALGITIGEDEFHTPTYDPDTLETNQENVYLAGVVCGGLNTRKWFIENSRIHADQIANHLANKILSA